MVHKTRRNIYKHVVTQNNTVEEGVVDSSIENLVTSLYSVLQSLKSEFGEDSLTQLIPLIIDTCSKLNSSAIEANSLKDTLNSIKIEFEELSITTERERNTCTKLRASIVELQEELDTLNKTSLSLEKHNSALLLENNSLKKQLTSSISDLSTVERDNQQLSSSLKSLNEKYAKIQESYDNLLIQINQQQVCEVVNKNTALELSYEEEVMLTEVRNPLLSSFNNHISDVSPLDYKVTTICSGIEERNDHVPCLAVCTECVNDSSLWLNDSEIVSYINSDVIFNTSDNDTFICDPIVTNILMSDYESAISHLGALNIKSKKFLFFIVNNSNCHWSLLFFSVVSLKWYYFDSINSNSNCDTQLVKNLARYLNLLCTEIFVTKICVPLQDNTVDCGVFVLYFLREIFLNRSYFGENFLFANVTESLTNIREKLQKCCPHYNSKLPMIHSLPENCPLKISKRRKVFILSDSHGRYLSNHLQFQLSTLFDVTANVCPNACLDRITRCISNSCEFYSKSDFLIILGGTNDIDQSSPYQYTLLKALNNLKNVLNKTNVIFFSIPPRFDRPLLSDINTANYVLFESIISRNPSHFVWVNWNGINRNSFTSHGLHMKKSFKSELALCLSALICSDNFFLPDRFVITSLSSLYTLVQELHSHEVHQDDILDESFITVDEWAASDAQYTPFHQICLNSIQK